MNNIKPPVNLFTAQLIFVYSIFILFFTEFECYNQVKQTIFPFEGQCQITA